MSDTVTCTAVLSRNSDTKHGSLFLACSPDWKMRIIPVVPLGQRVPDVKPQWEYEERGGRLHLFPSLLCTDTGFHTGYNWDCAFVETSDGGAYERFWKENPTIREDA